VADVFSSECFPAETKIVDNATPNRVVALLAFAAGCSAFPLVVNVSAKADDFQTDNRVASVVE